jgi:hypothetical protein
MRFFSFCSTLLACSMSLCADSKAKVDAGPAYVHLDILESGKTIDRMDMPAIRADANYLFDNGFCIKPTVLYGANKGSLLTLSGSIGQYIPLNDQWSLLPNAGISYSYIHTRIDLPDFGLLDLHEKFRSISPFLGIDVYYTFVPTWRICASIQYAWSRTHTEIQHLPKSKSHCQGPNYSVLLEKDITSTWSVNLGAGYNISLTKEKHGIRGIGMKLGLAYWF